MAVGLICRQRSEDAENIIRICLRQKAVTGEVALVGRLHQVLRRFLQSDLWRRLSAMNLQNNVNMQWKHGSALVEGVIDLLGTDNDHRVHVAQLKAFSPRHPSDEIVHRFEISLLCEGVVALSGLEVGGASLYYIEDGREEVLNLASVQQVTEGVVARIRRSELAPLPDAPCVACDHDWACALRRA